MLARFRVATRASGDGVGIRRQVYVHIYDDLVELQKAHAKALGHEWVEGENVAGGMASQTRVGFSWPKPDPGPVLVIRLWTQQLTTRTIAHEAGHAAAVIFFMDHLPGWDSRARGIYMGNNEPLCYAIGDITAEIVSGLYKIGLLP